jgi:hypothetical protein
VRHVDHEVRAHAACDLGKASPVDDARVGGKPGDDQLRPVLLGKALHLRIIDLAGVGTDAVLRGTEVFAGEVDLRPVRQVTAVVEAHAEDRIARLHQRQVGGGVRLRARVRLHVGEVGAEQPLGAVDGELLDDVHVLAAAVVALARIPFGVLVGEHRALRLQHSW